MLMKVLSKLFVLCFMIVAVVSMANAAEPIGRIVKLRGTVEAMNKTSGDSAVLKDGDSIFEGDLLKSEKGSFAKILMKDDTIFQLGPNTEMIFEKFKFKTKSERTATYNLVKGQLRSLFTVKSKDKSLTIKTPNTAMGIRGTEILSDVYKFKGKIKTDIALMSGKLDVDLSAMKLGEALKNNIIQLRPGQVFESDHFRKNFTGGKPIHKLIKRLPDQVFNNLKKPEKKGGQIFLLEARKQDRRDLYNGARFNFDRNGQEIKLPEGDEGKRPDLKVPPVDPGKAQDSKRGQGLDNGAPGKGIEIAKERQLPAGVKPPVVIKDREAPGEANSRARIGVSRDELDDKNSPQKKTKYQEERRQKEMKERQRMMKNKQMEERKKQAQMRREEMIRLREQELARIRAEEIKRIIFDRFSSWRDGLSSVQRAQIRQEFGVDIITPEIFCKIKPAACAL
ncbi:MAG: hypothetical protein EP326_14535 [Deltaproteobacteria bacterium]|nr:MAG: hypothetical protein EP326_14535 [Deltaproteobacteria bacterium]